VTTKQQADDEIHEDQLLRFLVNTLNEEIDLKELAHSQPMSGFSHNYDTPDHPDRRSAALASILPFTPLRTITSNVVVI
jgi:hypothetical protein